MEVWAIVVMFLIFAIAVTALVLAIVWRNKSDSTVPHDPIQIVPLLAIASAVSPPDALFTPSNNIQVSFSKISERQIDGKVTSSVVIEASGVRMTPVSGDATDLAFSFTVSQELTGVVFDNVVSLGTAIVPGVATPGPIGILQRPIVVAIGTQDMQFTMPYTFGGDLVPQDQTMELNFRMEFINTV